MSLQTETAYKYIKDRILNGTYKPSQKLVEAQLSEDVGVSRNTIKKALLMLQRENLVEMESNKGATIKSYSMDEIINYLEIREVLEGLVARNAANKISDADLHTLGLYMEQMKRHIEEHEFEQYSQLNQKFHEIIYTASKNKPAVEMIHIIKNQLSRIQFRTILVPGRNQESLREHIRIYEAMKSRDEKEASAAIEAHIRSIQQVIVQNYQFLQ